VAVNHRARSRIVAPEVKEHLRFNLKDSRMPTDIPAERAQLLASRAAEVAKLDAAEAEVDRFEAAAIATGAFAPGYQESKYGRAHQLRLIEQLDGRLESLDRRRTNHINASFRNLVLKRYPDAQRLLDIATQSVDPDGTV